MYHLCNGCLTLPHALPHYERVSWAWIAGFQDPTFTLCRCKLSPIARRVCDTSNTFSPKTVRATPSFRMAMPCPPKDIVRRRNSPKVPTIIRKRVRQQSVHGYGTCIHSCRHHSQTADIIRAPIRVDIMLPTLIPYSIVRKGLAESNRLKPLPLAQ